MTKNGKLDLIIGPMFSGKSTELIKKIRLFNVLHKKFIVVKPIIDSRYNIDSISTHDNITYTSININKLEEIKENYKDDYMNADILIIEEGQFLPDLLEFVIDSVNSDNKHIVVAGLSGDYNRNPIGKMMYLISHADTVEYKTALCTECGDGTLAPFTFKKIKDTNQILVGGNEIYTPLCRYHYNIKNEDNRQN